ncbi:MAG TPA: polysaccharide biosynthesis tyrosine autokinase [Opitutaceae bacterium]|nr:polysaccharide biosynthesis tyrosine autokinase [Lacunisphaera sp.]HWA09173.1 polysaccharide biosynthesis tyrosine autokinase [Opitutaceae bacterium]
MDSPKPSREAQRHSPGAQAYGPAGGYGYGPAGGDGYGNYGGYGGYPGYGETTVQRSLQDYLLILRERVWYIIAAFVVVFASALVYTYTRTPLYQSTATVEIFRRNPTVMQVQQVMDSEVRSAEDLNTQVNILKSTTIMQRVADKLTGDDLKRFIAPYDKPGAPAPSVLRLLEVNRDIVPQRLSLIVGIQYDHPDKEMAAKVANLFADEYIAYSAHVRVDESLKAVVDLEQRATEQRQKVDDIARALQAYREKNNQVSLDQRKDISTETLKTLNLQVTQSAAALQEVETRWKQVLATRQSGGDLLTLAAIAGDPTVAELQKQVAAAKIAVSQLSEHYRAKHPKMIEAANTLAEAQRQLQHVIETTAAQVEASYQSALQNYTQARAALAAQEGASLSMDRLNVEYSNMERDFSVNEKILENILSRMRETSMSSTVETQNARLVDHAAPGRKPISPNYLLNLGLGVVGGLAFGLALAFFVAYADDRVKSAYDIEAVVGLPLLAIVPKFKKPSTGDEAQGTGTAFVPPSEPEVAEAFSTLYSSLRLKDESKKAQCIVITSTVPGEGKSFIARNLALTFASHGERVLLMDCDLRRPVVHRAFHVENLKGVIDICTTGAALDDVIIKDIQPNLDVLPSGGRSKNPAQNLTSKNFEVLLADLRKRYDRIFIDTPPVALVSDAFVILPLADGSIYSIFFNKVRRKAAQFCVQRLLEISVPHFGAVLNGLDQNIGGYYYHHYYDKSYKQYYVSTANDQPGDAPRREAPVRTAAGPAPKRSRRRAEDGGRTTEDRRQAAGDRRQDAGDGEQPSKSELPGLDS